MKVVLLNIIRDGDKDFKSSTVDKTRLEPYTWCKKLRPFIPYKYLPTFKMKTKLNGKICFWIDNFNILTSFTSITSAEGKFEMFA